MRLEDIPECELDFHLIENFHWRHGDYILVRVEKDGAEKTVLRASNYTRGHKMMYEAFEKTVGDAKAVCLGGGHVQFFTEYKYLQVHGYSLTFGPEKNREAVTLPFFQKAYPDWTVSTESPSEE